MLQDYDPALLRKLAADYRVRARADRRMAATFTEIAREMEACAATIEDSRRR